MTSQILAYIGTALVIIAYVPQVRHLIRERCSAGISAKAYVIWGVAAVLLLIHAYLIDDIPFIIAQIVVLILDVIILSYAVRYRGNTCPGHTRKTDS